MPDTKLIKNLWLNLPFQCFFFHLLRLIARGCPQQALAYLHAAWLALVVASSGRIQDELTAILRDYGLKIQVGIPQISTSRPKPHSGNSCRDQGCQIESN